MTPLIRSISDDAQQRAALLALNNAHAQETSPLDAARFDELVAAAAIATAIAPAQAFLIAFDEASSYDGGHFLWFRARLERFLYIDRVLVSESARRQGLARKLYADLMKRAVQSGHRVVTCEVNHTPANPISDAFHASLGFQATGVGIMEGGRKTVRYLVRHL